MPAKRTKQSLDPLAMVHAADAAVAREKISERDSPTDRLFQLLMARIDFLQADRASYLQLFDRMRMQPALLGQIAPAVCKSMQQILNHAGLACDQPRFSLQTLGLFTVYMATLRAWQKDTSADLSTTMRILDHNLQRANTIGAWLGFESC